jgi:hypothetical protein
MQQTASSSSKRRSSAGAPEPAGARAWPKSMAPDELFVAYCRERQRRRAERDAAERLRAQELGIADFIARRRSV